VEENGIGRNGMKRKGDKEWEDVLQPSRQAGRPDERTHERKGRTKNRKGRRSKKEGRGNKIGEERKQRRE
jgi:hypothetical protein